jgi:hypothetical protein
VGRETPSRSWAGSPAPVARDEDRPGHAEAEEAEHAAEAGHARLAEILAESGAGTGTSGRRRRRHRDEDRPADDVLARVLGRH